MGSGLADPPQWESPLPREARTHQGRHAGIVSRTVAVVVDVVVLAVILAGLYLGATGVVFVLDPVGFRFPAPPRAVLLGTGLGVAVCYFALCWAVTGRTAGGQLFGVRVLDRRGRPPRWAPALLRAVACVFFPAGLLWAIGPKRRSLQDIVLRTAVVYDWQASSPEPREARGTGPRDRGEVSGGEGR
ncbi:RDD family protein [Amycolatopsis sp. GM8]|uniref:RDD family protein n=1 Tax=Amycolatopsis sp. GM8 TaxID=2896530 RepID=UPI001F2D2A30|nr:RDD family protein [Amycolatopsis sp. GM8]